MGNSWTQNYYHVVFGTKNRLPIIREDFEPRLFTMIGGIVKDLRCTALSINGMSDHVHVLVHYRSDLSHSDLVRHIKSRSTKWIHDTIPDMTQFAWQEGYGGFTVGHTAVPSVRQYIMNQKSHHKHLSFRDEFMEMLMRAGITASEADVFN